MNFPAFIKPGDTIGVTATSHGIDWEPDQQRFRNGARQLKEKGYDTVFTENVFTADVQGRSSSGEARGEQFNRLVADEKVKAIYSASGGDFLLEMLPYVDYDLFAGNPKWVQGYSDNTSLLYSLTTKTGISTAYGANFGDFGMEPWHNSVSRGLEILEGKCLTQSSFETYQDGFMDRGVKDGYVADCPVCWENVYLGNGNTCTDPASNQQEKIVMEGRLLGGCFDVLVDICGTRYDNTLPYIEKLKEDGIIWFMESFDMSTETLISSLWRLQEFGWFQYVKGFIFGRPMFFREGLKTTYEEALVQKLACLNVPIIANADIGHKGPQFVMIEGAKARIESQGGKGSVTYLR